MKFKFVAALVALVAGGQIPMGHASVRPTIESFTFTPNEIDLASSNTELKFQIVASHPFGIENMKVNVTLKNSRNDSIIAELYRTDSPRENNKTRVTFEGQIEFPRDLMPGNYSVSVDEIKNNSSAGYQFSSGLIYAPAVRDLIGAKSGLLVRKQGELNLSIDTFVGPTFSTTENFIYEDGIKYYRGKTPIWRVGENLNPSEYFESKVPALSMRVLTSTPQICSTDGSTLKFNSIGVCTYKVYTQKTKDYIEHFFSDSVSIDAARIKVELFIDSIPDQTATGLPKTIQLMPVYSPASGYILAQSETPQTCLVIGFTVQILSGGTCKLAYQSPETSTYKASDVYRQTFEITRTTQTLYFVPVNSVVLSAKTLTLSATASSELPVSFSAEPTSNCTVSGNALTLLKPGPCNVTAQQVGTATIAPVSKTVTITITGKAAPIKRTISCVKGSKTVKVTKVNPKCPKGYSRVR